MPQKCVCIQIQIARSRFKMLINITLNRAPFIRKCIRFVNSHTRTTYHQSESRHQSKKQTNQFHERFILLSALSISLWTELLQLVVLPSGGLPKQRNPILQTDINNSNGYITYIKQDHGIHLGSMQDTFYLGTVFRLSSTGNTEIQYSVTYYFGAAFSFTCLLSRSHLLLEWWIT